MASLTQSAILNGIEPSSRVTLESDTLAPSHNGLESSSHVTCQGSPPSLAQRRKSRIPRFLPSSVPGAKPALMPKPEVKPVPVPMQMVRPSVVPVQMAKPMPQRETHMTQAKSMPVHENKIEAVSEPLQTTKLSPAPKQEVKSTPPKSTCVMKPVATSTPSKPVSRKVDHFFLTVSSYFKFSNIVIMLLLIGIS